MRPERWATIERLYYEVLPLGAEERGRVLTEACGGDADLRREIESLLARGSGAGFLSTPALAFTSNGSIPVGGRVGPYAIATRIGEGGMGEVYRAHDTKLGRDVAIKILPRIFTSDPERLARFEREARVLASLNHPHIGAIYGLEESDGVRALILELVEGDTLADRLARGPTPIAEALTLARQITDALEAAHDQGIVHRDLKPANIKITPQGVVKVLDFGLAKFAPQRTGEAGGTRVAGWSNDPIFTIASTKEGLILGTVPYMSPEQARGHAVDKRTDIWAFGCVLFEMLTGRAAFPSDTASDVIAGILDREPSWHTLPDEVPSAVQELLQHCLAKDPQQRLRDIADARFALERKPKVPPASASKTDTGWKATAAVAMVVATTGLIGWWSTARSASPPPPIVRLPLELGATAGDPAFGASAILSPDGTRVVYRGRTPRGTVQLFIRGLDSGDVTPLAATDDALAPFFAPDGQSIGFFDEARLKLKRFSLKEGKPVDVCEALYARGGSWGEDGNIVASISARGPLYRIPSSGGPPQPITELGTAVTHRWPQVLPGSQSVIFTSNNFIGDFDQATIEIQSLTTGQRSTLVHGGYYGRYVPTGHLVYLRNDTMYAAPVDVVRQRVTGAAVPLINGVRTRVGGGGAAFDISAAGTLIYAQGNPIKYRLGWLDKTGHVEMLRARASQYNYALHFSPDGTRLALSTAEGGSLDVWVYEWPRDTWTRLTSSPDLDLYPVWSPDGTHIAFMSGIGASGTGMFWKRADGSGESVQLALRKNPVQPSSFSPTGNYLAFSESDPETKSDLWLLPLEGAQSDHPRAGEAVPFLRTPFNEAAPMISPDGRWMAYQSDETGVNEVYVRAFPGPGGQWTISTGGGSEPHWAKNTRELFFRTAEGIMVVSYNAFSAAFAPSPPRLLVARKGLGWFDVSPDGKRFVIIDEDTPEDTHPTHFTFVLNFFDELKRRVDAAK